MASSSQDPFSDLDSAKKYLQEDLAKLIEEARLDYTARANELAQDIIISAMLHGATSYTAEYTVSQIALTNEAIKGSIIGQGGRNIAAFEKATGVEIEIEEGNTIRLSSFDSLPPGNITNHTYDFLTQQPPPSFVGGS